MLRSWQPTITKSRYGLGIGKLVSLLESRLAHTLSMLRSGALSSPTGMKSGIAPRKADARSSILEPERALLSRRL